MSLKPWREIAEPHADVREGKFQQAEFAADLSRVHAGTANAEYQNPALFFQRTFSTEGMHLWLNSVVKRLAGQGGDPVIQLQTAFGGGKTHTMLAMYHLAKHGAALADRDDVRKLMLEARVEELPQARVAVIDGDLLTPSQPRVTKEGITLNTLWGEIAYQLGLALRDEIADLEAAGAKAVQVDEPALREGLPLKRCLLYTSPSPRDRTRSRMTSSA